MTKFRVAQTHQKINCARRRMHTYLITKYISTNYRFRKRISSERMMMMMMMIIIIIIIVVVIVAAAIYWLLLLLLLLYAQMY